jgi:hypothetical protein
MSRTAAQLRATIIVGWLTVPGVRHRPSLRSYLDYFDTTHVINERQEACVVHPDGSQALRRMLQFPLWKSWPHHPPKYCLETCRAVRTEPAPRSQLQISMNRGLPLASSGPLPLPRPTGRRVRPPHPHGAPAASRRGAWILSHKRPSRSGTMHYSMLDGQTITPQVS